jgi:uncharacterized protein YndB with AHSA1/START domain
METAIIIEGTLNAPVSKVWKAISNKDEMKQWYFDIKEFKPEVGFEFMFSAGNEEKKYTHLCKITEVLREQKLSYTWAYEGVPVQTLVTFELFKEGPDKTRVRLIHKGVEKFPADNKDLAKENFADGWTPIIGTSLKEYVEKA